MFFQPILLNDEAFDIRIANMGNFSLHWHSDLEIIFCREGTFNIYVAEKKYTVTKNDIVLVGS
ncbi:MAG: AraC family ligand binding domain-containing protein [Clostridia bacterium]|nr:AraC family ligand binding domain-containing protein [Clostridia bacterium]